ncbi:hypothetical protein CEXT_128651 [Caerostris extrusa]|uniref:Uncharacterized protein n=1 Tax=Caerostris extrusa TaxID=172846 RepID=A0AAV4V673_CAEEX|nr:hypothetical protein CEXT_128651 [Caerostris extrusa]
MTEIESIKTYGGAYGSTLVFDDMTDEGLRWKKWHLLISEIMKVKYGMPNSLFNDIKRPIISSRSPSIVFHLHELERAGWTTRYSMGGKCHVLEYEFSFCNL